MKQRSTEPTIIVRCPSSYSEWHTQAVTCSWCRRICKVEAATRTAARRSLKLSLAAEKWAARVVDGVRSAYCYNCDSLLTYRGRDEASP
jgi:hypothetical protein